MRFTMIPLIINYRVSIAVDSNLNAKLADLEMGGQGESEKSVLLGTDDILVNWVAPEVKMSETPKWRGF